MNQATLAAISGGKDSTAMVHLLLELGVPIDYLVHFECEWEWPEMAAHFALMESMTGLRITHIRNYRHFDDLLRRYGWPKSAGGWCTASKRDNSVKFGRAVGATLEYIGFAYDERERANRKTLADRSWGVRFPLIEAEMTEADALQYCNGLGYHWNGLYDIVDRIGCWCCPKAGKARREILRRYRPALYRRLLEMDAIAEREDSMPLFAEAGNE